MSLDPRSASPAAVVGRSSGSAALYALCLIVFGAIVLLLATWIASTAGHQAVSLGIVAGGTAGLVVATLVFGAWMRALERSMRDVLRAFGVGFFVKLIVLVAGTLIVHFLLPGVSSAGFAIAFGCAILWVMALGIPYIHRKGGRSGAERGASGE